MRTRLFFGLLAIIPSVAAADDPFACVDPDIRHALLGNTFPPDAQISTGVPAEFSDVALPASMEVIGTYEDSHSVRVAYKTSGTSADVVRAATDFLVESGWLELEDYSRAFRGGFQARARQQHSRVCRDDVGMVSITANDENATTYVSLQLARQMSLYNCETLASTELGYRRFADLRAELPVLNFADGVSATSMGSGGGGDDIESRAVATTELGRAFVVSDFNDQIRNQGWEFDSAWSGARSAGSVWTKESSDGKPMIGKLSAFDLADNAYNLRFTVYLLETDRLQSSVGVMFRSN